MALNLSDRVGPNGRPVLKLKGFNKPAANKAPEPVAPTARNPSRPPAWEWLKATFPAIRKKLPLALGVGDDIHAAARAAGYSKTEVKRNMRLLTRSLVYQRHLATEGAMRHTLAGTPIEPVALEHMAHAAVRVLMIEMGIAARSGDHATGGPQDGADAPRDGREHPQTSSKE